MPKTKRELYQAIANKVGGEHGKRMLECFQQAPFTDLLDKEISDEEFDLHLKKAEHDLPMAFARLEEMAREQPTVLGGAGKKGMPGAANRCDQS